MINPDNIIETFQKDDFKVVIFKTGIEGEVYFAYVGIVYYKDKQIKYIPACSGNDYLSKIKKYAKNLCEKHNVVHNGITISYDNIEETYHIFPEFEPQIWR